MINEKLKKLMYEDDETAAEVIRNLALLYSRDKSLVQNLISEIEKADGLLSDFIKVQTLEKCLLAILINVSSERMYSGEIRSDFNDKIRAICMKLSIEIGLISKLRTHNENIIVHLINKSDSNRKGRFIAFEGIDGSGKSTQVKKLKELLMDRSSKVYDTFEPTDSPIGSIIRQVMKGRIKTDDKTIAGLFVADRLDHIQNDVNGMLLKQKEGFVVISDRYYFSSYAYHGTHMDLDWVINANALSAEILRPDVNVFLDISPELAIDRIHNSRNDIELYETHANLKAVREKYFEAFKKERDREVIELIDASGSIDDIFNRVKARLEYYL